VFNSLFEDREGSIWLPTDGQGLYRVRKQAITIFRKRMAFPIADRNIYPIYQDRAGTIWIGTWNGGLVATLVGEVALIHSVYIPREERYLERKFGAQYLDYRASVRRWL
jgi:ligand-binding sensor domain-containing protein